MLHIQVLGRGLIPRGLGLAPRKEFFKADLNLINTILMTPGLKVNIRNPEDGKIIPVTKENVKKLWDKYRSDRVKPVATEKNSNTIVNEVKDTKTEDSSIFSKVDNTKFNNPTPVTPVTTPLITPIVTPADTKPESAVLNSKIDTTPVTTEDTANSTDKIAEEPKVEEAKEESNTIKPIIAPEENKNNQNNNNNRHNNKR